MNVLLLNPAFPDTFWSFKHAIKFVRKSASLPPLGLLTVAAMLPPDWGKRLCDLNIETLKGRDLRWADLVFIGGMVVQREDARRLIARCKAAGRTIVAGGPLFADDYENYPEVDHFVLNEGELTLPEFLADYARGQARRVYQTPQFADLRQTPVPLWGLANLKRYVTANIQFSRGCPFNCDFCNVTKLLGHRVRTKTATQIVAELDDLYAHGWRAGVFFVDDNLIGNKRYLSETLLPALIQWRADKPRISFLTEASINLADDEPLMRQLVAAGFDTVFVGIETPNEDALHECGKRQNEHRDLAASVRRMQHCGLQVQAGFIVGFDSDTETIFQRQIDFIQQTGIVTAMVGMLQAFPGTQLHARMKAEGRLTGTLTGDNVDGTTNIVPKMGLARLSNGYRQILDHIYSPKPYYQRVRTFLREYRPPRLERPVTWAQYLAFARSVVHLGIIGRERIEYWKLLLWTWWRQREALPLAVTLAIYGHHFRKICELHISR